MQPALQNIYDHGVHRGIFNGIRLIAKSKPVCPVELSMNNSFCVTATC
ncbi:hypothetical protein CBM2633_A10279 [Cupriavidus taiwanensis]|nr:hypothetical protein CBM2633_A10279 [Cupriavidus taiwanensis]